MPSAVDICNTALSHIGAENEVAAIDPPDGSVEAGRCARFYPIARRLALGSHNWTFARARATLAAVTNPSTVWLYAYAVPSGMLHARRILSLQTIDTAGLVFADSTFTNWHALDDLFSERGSSDFEVEGDTILTNEPEAVLLYTRDVTDVSKYPPMFTSALGMLLAGYLAGPTIKGTAGMQVGQAWTQNGMAGLGTAAMSDANGTTERADFFAPSLRARG
jgi:hypothetical protein